jgi:hypothetical protein
MTQPVNGQSSGFTVFRGGSVKLRLFHRAKAIEASSMAGVSSRPRFGQMTNQPAIGAAREVTTTF